MTGLPNGPAGAGEAGEWDASERSVSSYHQALQAALKLGAVLDQGSISPARLVKLEALSVASNARGSSDAPRRDTLLRHYFGSAANDLPPKYAAGFCVYWLTGCAGLVLDALTLERQVQRELAWFIRPCVGYLLLLATVASMGYLGVFSGLTALTDFQNDLLRQPRPSAEPLPGTGDAAAPLTPWLGLGVVVVLVIALCRPVSAMIALGLGGGGYRRSRRSTVAARLRQELTAAGCHAAEAIRLAHELTAAPPLERKNGATATPASQLFSESARVAFLAEHYRLSGNQRLRLLRVVSPLVLVIGVGGLGVLVYCLLLFWPLSGLLFELAEPLANPSDPTVVP